MRPLLVLGTSDFAVENALLAREIPGLEVAGFVENMRPERCGTSLEGLPILWVDELKKLAATHAAVCGLGTTKRHLFIAQAEGHGIPFATLIHPAATVSASCSIGEGCIINAGAVIAARARIGNHVCINRGALIGHHTAIGAYATVSPGSNIAGSCRIGERAYVGIGAIVCDHVEIGEGTLVSAGSLVSKSIPARVQVAGAPARIIKRDFDGL